MASTLRFRSDRFGIFTLSALRTRLKRLNSVCVSVLDERGERSERPKEETHLVKVAVRDVGDAE